MSERELIERARKGDRAAEREIYDAHVDRVYRLAYRMCGRADLAEDFVQETFVKAFGALDKFRGDAALSTWLHSIATRGVLNGLRSAKRHERRAEPLVRMTYLASDISHLRMRAGAPPVRGRGRC